MLTFVKRHILEKTLDNRPVNQYIRVMNTIGIFEAKTKLSQVCEHVNESREPVLITKRGIPFVMIEPVRPSGTHRSRIWEQRKAFLDRYGEWSVDFEVPARNIPSPPEALFDE